MTADAMDRLAVLSDLLAMARPLEEIAAQLADMEWDYEGEGVELSRQHLATVLQRFLNNTLLADDVECWANLIEGREDVCFESGCGQKIEEVLFELANPLLTQPLDRSRAAVLLSALI